MASTTTTTTASPPLSAPFILVPGVSNARDAGGHALAHAPARKVRDRYLFRSADPSMITLDGVAALKELGITTVYDLRSHPEIARMAARRALGEDLTSHGLEVVAAPVFPDEDWRPEAQVERHLAYAGTDDVASAASFADAYADIFAHGAAGPFRSILLHIRDRPEHGLLCHCSAGKDRTGVAVALLLMLAGCSDDAIIHDYALSEAGLAARMGFIVDHIMRQPGIDGDRAKAERAAGAKPESMAAALQLFRRTYGSVEAYVRERCGLNDDDIELVRSHMIVDVGA